MWFGAYVCDYDGIPDVIGCLNVFAGRKLDMIGGSRVWVVPVGCGWCPRVWLWQLDVFDPEVRGMTIG